MIVLGENAPLGRLYIVLNLSCNRGIITVCSSFREYSFSIRANFKSLGLFLLITHFGARQDHFDAPIASFLRKSAKNLNFERFSPYPVLRDFFFSDVKQAQLFLFKHIEQLLHCYGDHTEHQMAKDFPMPLHSDMASAVIVFQIRIPAFNC